MAIAGVSVLVVGMAMSLAARLVHWTASDRWCWMDLGSREVIEHRAFSTAASGSMLEYLAAPAFEFESRLRRRRLGPESDAAIAIESAWALIPEQRRSGFTHAMWIDSSPTVVGFQVQDTLVLLMDLSTGKEVGPGGTSSGALNPVE